MKASPQILIAEDDYEDCFIITEIFKELNYVDSIQLVENGVKLIDYLGDKSADSIKLIVLDLNMPMLNGTETLRILKKDQKFCHIPVIIFSTSVNHREMEACMSLGAMEYITKPSNYSQYMDVCNRFFTISANA